jgi:hypothetical protein
MKFNKDDKIILDKESFELKQQSRKEMSKVTTGEFSIREIIGVDFSTKDYKIKTKFGFRKMSFKNEYLYRLATPKEIKEDQLKKILTLK